MCIRLVVFQYNTLTKVDRVITWPQCTWISGTRRYSSADMENLLATSPYEWKIKRLCNAGKTLDTAHSWEKGKLHKSLGWWRLNTSVSCVKVSSEIRLSRKQRLHDAVIKWRYFPLYWPFIRRIHRSPVDSPHKGQWHTASMFSLMCSWTNSWANSPGAGDFRHHGAHCDVIVVQISSVDLLGGLSSDKIQPAANKYLIIISLLCSTQGIALKLRFNQQC